MRSRKKNLLASFRDGAMRGGMKRKVSLIVAGIGAIIGFGIAAAAEPLEIGKPVPDVKAQTHDGKTIKLQEATAKGWALVYFYPKAATGG